MRLRWKILIGMGIFMALSCAVSFVTMRVQPQNKVEAYKQFLREHGEKLEITEVMPPPVPPASNSVAAVQSAFAMFGSGAEDIPNAMKMVAPGKALVGWMQPDARGYDFTNSWDDFSARVILDRPALELLHQVLEKTDLDFQLDYKKGFKLLMPHLAQLKRATQKLDAAVICDLHNGDTGSAITNLLTMLALVQRNEGEGVLISHLVRIAMLAIAISPTWELLQATNVPDARLAAAQDAWARINFLKDAANTFPLERAWAVKSIEKSRASHEEFANTFGMWGGLPGGSGGSSGAWSWPPDWEEITEKPRFAVGEAMWRSSWSYGDELAVLQNEQVIMETLRAMQTNRSQFLKADYDAMQARLSKLGIAGTRPPIFRTLKIPDMGEFLGVGSSLGNMVLKDMRIEAARRVVITAIALKRFQMKHGKLPETLDELAPEFFAAVPIDPYDGKPLRYHPGTDGTYLLYCVGEDGVDDGGDASLPPAVTSTSLYWNNTKARDWVWPQPATEAEIKFFYDNPPK